MVTWPMKVSLRKNSCKNVPRNHHSLDSNLVTKSNCDNRLIVLVQNLLLTSQIVTIDRQYLRNILHTPLSVTSHHILETRATSIIIIKASLHWQKSACGTLILWYQQTIKHDKHTSWKLLYRLKEESNNFLFFSFAFNGFPWFHSSKFIIIIG